MSRHRSALRQRPNTAKWSRRGVAKPAEPAHRTSTTEWTPTLEWDPASDNTGSDVDLTLGSIRGITRDGDRYHIARVWSDGPNPEADARLLVAAPKLYEVLLEAFENYGPRMPLGWLTKADAALALARSPEVP